MKKNNMKKNEIDKIWKIGKMSNKESRHEKLKKIEKHMIQHKKTNQEHIFKHKIKNGPGEGGTGKGGQAGLPWGLLVDPGWPPKPWTTNVPRAASLELCCSAWRPSKAAMVQLCDPEEGTWRGMLGGVHTEPRAHP